MKNQILPASRGNHSWQRDFMENRHNIIFSTDLLILFADFDLDAFCLQQLLNTSLDRI
jgi:hypothetical protein